MRNNFEKNDEKNIEISPKNYAESAVLSQEIGRDLLTRLDFMAANPKRIGVVGCRVGDETTLLKMRYPDAKIYAFDVSVEMLQHAKKADDVYICHDGIHLPIQKNSIDLLIAHFFLPWQSDFKTIFNEWRRVLTPDGLVLMSALGPDTLREIPNEIALKVNLLDMHHLGDQLLSSGFADVVLDVDYITMTYKNEMRLRKELFYSGMIETISSEISLPLSLTYEVIYAHAFSPVQNGQRDEDGNVKIPVASLRRVIK